MDVERLYRQHHEALRRYLERYAGDAEVAADAAHEAYLRLVATPPRDESDLRGWLFRVATNVVRDGWRRQRTAERLRPPAAQVEPDAARLAELSERLAEVEHALARIAPRLRAVLLMRAEGFSHREIAQALGISANSVGPLAGRALTRLRRILRPKASTD